jgi:hypothetical protein
LKSLESDLEVEATATAIEEREWVNKWRRELDSCRGEWGKLTLTCTRVYYKKLYVKECKNMFSPYVRGDDL